MQLTVQVVADVAAAVEAAVVAMMIVVTKNPAPVVGVVAGATKD